MKTRHQKFCLFPLLENKQTSERILPVASGKAVCSSIEGKKSMKNKKQDCGKVKFKRKDREHKHKKKMGKKSENGPITVATTTDAWSNSPLLPDLQ